VTRAGFLALVVIVFMPVGCGSEVSLTDDGSSVAAAPTPGPGPAPTLDTTAPSTPTGLSAAAVGSTAANVSWNASSDNVGVTGYIVRRDGVQIATPTTLILTDTGLSAGQAYAYTVAARDAAGNVSPFSTGAIVTTAAAPPPDTVLPTIPTNLTTAPAVNSVTLGWNPSTDNIGVVGYVVRRNATPVATVPTTNYVDSGLAPSTSYGYTVSAIDAAGNASPESAEARTTTLAPTAPPPPAPPPLSGTALGTLAASMAPGTWAQLNAGNQNSALGVGPISSTMLHYGNTEPWNPFSKVIELLNKDAGAIPYRHVRYDVATNQFVVVAANAGIPTLGHGYDHNTVNPYTGDFYHRLYSAFSGTISVRVKALGAPSFGGIPGMSDQIEQVAIGTAWWSGSFTGSGAQGALVVFNSGNSTGGPNDGHIAAFNPLTNSWFFSRTGMAPNYGSGSTYHSVIEYSPIKNVAVYGGGNVAGNRLWRLNSDGSFTTMPNVPPGKGVGMQQGLLVNEPITGNFLLLSGGELWELDPSGSGTWTQQTGTRNPPSGVGRPGPGSPEAIIASSISDYGVIAFITQPSSTGGTFYLYKHR